MNISSATIVSLYLASATRTTLGYSKLSCHGVTSPCALSCVLSRGLHVYIPSLASIVAMGIFPPAWHNRSLHHEWSGAVTVCAIASDHPFSYYYYRFLIPRWVYTHENGLVYIFYLDPRSLKNLRYIHTRVAYPKALAVERPNLYQFSRFLLESLYFSSRAEESYVFLFSPYVPVP